ncbi:MAG: tetratricopeptide repeat protein [Flavobacteriales bacterium AspAUS03]
MKEEFFFNDELIARFKTMIKEKRVSYFDPGEFADIIMYYLDLSDLEYAAKALSLAKTQHPYDAEIKIREAEVFLAYGNLPEAVQLIEELKHIVPNHTDFLIMQAKYWSLSRASLKAISFYKEALKNAEDENYLYSSIGDEYLRIQEIRKALYHFKKALEFYPRDEYAFYSCIQCFDEIHLYKECVHFLNQYLDIQPYSEVAWFQLGLKQLKLKNYHEAHVAFDYAIVIDNTFLNAYDQKARCLEQMHRYNEAIKVYEEAFHLEKSPALAYFKIGLCYNKMEEPLRALRFFQQAIYGDPQLEKSWSQSAFIYERFGNYQKALCYLSKAIDLSRNNLIYWKHSVYLNLQLGYYEEAIIAYQKILQLQPDWYDHWMNCSKLLMKVGDYHQVIKLLKKAFNKFGKFGELNYYISCCYFLIKQEKEGLIELAKAIEAAPELCKVVMSKYPFIFRKNLVKKFLTKFHFSSEGDKRLF